MAVTVEQFRSDYPPFASVKTYPDSLVTFWLGFAYLMLPNRRWGGLLDIGAELFVAHNLVLEGLSASEGANGAPPGMTVGPIVTKTVGELTITYDPAVGVNPDDTSWNLTSYGSRLIKIGKQLGTAWVQLGIGRAPPGSGPAWGGITQAGYNGIQPD